MNREQRGDFLRKVIAQVREREYPYAERPPQRVDWSAYDVAQANEIADVLEMIRVVVDKAEERLARRRPPSPPGPGRPPVAAADVAKVLLAQSYLGVSNRVAQGLVRLLWRNLGLRGPFSYKTIERGYDRAAVDALLEEALALTNLPVRGAETTFSIDGTGTPTRVRGNYAEARERQRRGGGGKAEAFPRGPHDFVYAVGTVGVAYGLIASWKNTADHRRGELSFFEPVIRETRARHPGMRMVVGDGLYAVRPCVRLVAELGAVPRFLPRRNVTLKRFGVKAWPDMLFPLVEDPQAWLRDHYQREASETVNGVLKGENPAPLRKRLGPRRCTEEKLRPIVQNARRLCYLRYLRRLSSVPVIQAA